MKVLKIKTVGDLDCILRSLEGLRAFTRHCSGSGYAVRKKVDKMTNKELFHLWLHCHWIVDALKPIYDAPVVVELIEKAKADGQS